MRKSAALLVAVGLIAAFALALGGVAFAEPSDACGGQPAMQTPNGAVICITGAPISGSVTIDAVPNQADPTTSTGFIVADGDSTNPDPLDGYIGVEANNAADGGGLNVVGCSSGDYTPGGANHVLGGQNNPPVIPPDPADPCLPAAPTPPGLPV